MMKLVRTALALVCAVLLLSAITTAQAKTKAKPDQKTATAASNQQHHSKLSKAAFWHQDRNAVKNAKPAKNVKPAKATKSTSNKTASKTAQAMSPKTAKVKPVSSKTSGAKKAQPAVSKTKASSKKPTSASKKTPAKA